VSYYYSKASDHPGHVISHPLLRGDNYEEWAINLETALASRKKFGFLDGRISKPEEDSSDFDDWKSINALLVSWIKMTIEPNLRSNISHKPVARDLWEHIKKHFCVSNGPRVQQLRKELSNCRQDGLSIETYYGKLTKLWDNMDACRPRIVCTCGKCICDCLAVLETLREHDKVHDFLMGLDESAYGTVRSSLLIQEPLPSLEYVYLKVTQDEDSRSHKQVSDSRPDGMVFAAQHASRVRPGERSSSTTVCTNCGRTGHMAESCFQILGFPEWWGDRPRNQNGRGCGTKSNGSGRGGGVVARDNVAQGASSSEVVHANVAITDADRAAVLNLTDEQWISVKRAINATKGNSDEQLSGKSSSTSWILDTGATNHLTCRRDILENVRKSTSTPIILADNRIVMGDMVGSVTLNKHLKLHNVFYIEDLGFDLISVTQLMEENDCVMQLSVPFCVLQDRTTRTLIGVGKPSGGLVYFRSTEVAVAVKGVPKQSLELWHQRLGHPSLKVVESLPDFVFSSHKDFSNKACDVCIRAKQTSSSFPISNNKTTEIFEMIHCDIWGPYCEPSSSGARYFLTIVDDYSRGTWLYLMKNKSDTQTKLRDFIALVDRQFGKKVRVLRSDNGGEFLSLTSYFLASGIVHETSCVGTPQQNGRVERKHRHLLNVARAIMFQGSLPIQFWGECALNAAYLINRTPSMVLNGKTPYKVLFGKRPSYDHLRTIGCLCYIHNQDHHGDKFASRSRKCVFVGYPYAKKGWRVYDLEKEIFCVSRDVVFDEGIFPFHNDLNPLPLTLDTTSSLTPFYSDDDDDDNGPTTCSVSVPPVPVIPLRVAPISLADSGSKVDLPNDDLVLPDSASTTPLPTDPKPTRERRQPAYLADYETTFLCGSSSTPYPISDVLTDARFSSAHKAFLTAITLAHEPATYAEAFADPKWRDATKEEIDALVLNHTWDIEDLPLGKVAIGSKWVFKVKHR